MPVRNIMRAPRRFLPSLPLLAAFEAAARTGSITQAAHELSLTQSAVSRQIKTLEGQLGVMLFIREKQSIRLTYGGEIYAREVRDALQKISNASLKLRASPTGGTLTLGILPTFGTRWLAPRLPDFMARHPEVTVNMFSRASRFDFGQDVVDAAIHFGPPEWPGAELALLRGETVLPLCAPALAAKYAFTDPADLRRAPLLHLNTRPDAWEGWLRKYGVDDSAVYGMLFDQFATLSRAAMAGMGIALMPEFLFEDEIRSGALVPALNLPLRSPGAYYLAWPQDRSDYMPLQLFRDWLLDQTAADR
ncbi:LysR family transcriptional regulator [Phaeovulum sp. NW3]|nr:LysR family transcriptional regulator [Phaeovulum sp. NW3]